MPLYRCRPGTRSAPMPFNYILFILYILYPRCYIYCVYRYILITYVCIRIYSHSRPEHRAPGAPAHELTKSRTRRKERTQKPTQAPYIAPLFLWTIPRPSRAHDARRSFTQSYSSPHPFIYKYLRYILYILKIYNIYVYIMCIYISIGIYKISVAKKRANRTQKEYTHSQSKEQSNTTKKRESTAKRSKDTATPSTTRC